MGERSPGWIPVTELEKGDLIRGGGGRLTAVVAGVAETSDPDYVCLEVDVLGGGPDSWQYSRSAKVQLVRPVRRR